MFSEWAVREMTGRQCCSNSEPRWREAGELHCSPSNQNRIAIRVVDGAW